MRHLNRKFDDVELHGKPYEIESVAELNTLSADAKVPWAEVVFSKPESEIFKRIWASADEEGQKQINRYAKNYGLDTKKMIAEAKRGAL